MLKLYLFSIAYVATSTLQIDTKPDINHKYKKLRARNVDLDDAIKHKTIYSCLKSLSGIIIYEKKKLSKLQVKHDRLELEEKKTLDKIACNCKVFILYNYFDGYQIYDIETGQVIESNIDKIIRQKNTIKHEIEKLEEKIKEKQNEKNAIMKARIRLRKPKKMHKLRQKHKNISKRNRISKKT
ncbi:hypothetical protein BDAP_000578 [Binucleata daphniae]